ncbi:MAG: cbb3-type cytochrome c oxidase subunit I [Chitinophagaceae bacterium]|nr:cbb3-type cytochrome c oxidase subunit I [Chitinophagaceae bacterium]
MLQISSDEIKKQRKLVITWGVTFLIAFPLLIVLGLLMRLNQGEVFDLGMDTFYVLMTLHGLGMAGVLYSMAFAALWYLISTRYAKLNLATGYVVYFLILLGVAGLTIATLIGKFGAGWYLLYPLPFKGTFWPGWATGLSIISLLILGVAWLVGIIHLIYALAKEFGGFTNLLGWQYLRKKEVDRELPPIVMITTVSLVPGVIAFLAGAVFLIMFLMQHLEPSLAFDPLLLKNLIFFFGHTLVNITLYCCIGWVYALLPEYTGRPWKTDKIVVYSWNATFFFILFAYFHHLYMDFVQPVGFQYAGQIASYMSAIPATAITMFGVIAQLYHSKVKWGVIPLAFLFGTAGWAIGGFSAVVDSTIAANKVLHNTLWVPAHFHTYMLGGVVLFILGFLFYLSHTKEEQEKDKSAKIGLWVFVIAVHSFIAFFYRGGLRSIPRRYADYKGIPIEKTHETGVVLAKYATIFIWLILIALLIMYMSIIIRLMKKKATPQPVSAKNG